MKDLFQLQFNQNIKAKQLWSKESRLVLATSGGVDSIVLLHLIESLPSTQRPYFVVAHVNHQLREASQQEAVHLADYCNERKIPYYQKNWEVTDHPQSGIEKAARDFRYQFFTEALQEINGSHLVTAHHGDDQAETVLMKLTRGSQLEGIVGLQYKRSFSEKAQLVRPLLLFSKKEIYQYAVEKELIYFEDQSNQDLAYTRNRFRAQVMPVLKQENPQLLPHIQRFSENLADMLAVVTPMLEENLAKLTLAQERDCWELDLLVFESYPNEMQRLLLDHWVKKFAWEHQFEYKEQVVADLLKLALNQKKPNGEIRIQKAYKGRKTYQRLMLMKVNADKPEQEPSALLSLDDWQTLQSSSKIGFFSSETAPAFLAKDRVVYLAVDSVELPLKVRKRQPGDKMSLKGSAGIKKVKDIFIDEKVPLENRNRAYLIEDQQGKIIWLLDYKESQLSISPETDKIHYILIFREENEV